MKQRADGQSEPAAFVNTPVKTGYDHCLQESVCNRPEFINEFTWGQAEIYQWCDKLATTVFCEIRDIERQLLGSYN